MKKLLSFVLSIAIILTMAINCFAVEAETFDNISESMNRNAMTDCALIAQSQMDRYGNNQTIIGISEVYNTANELIAYCYNFEPDGYVIVTIADYVPQVVAPNHETPYPHDVVTSGIKYAYGGGLNFWTISTDGMLTDIKTGVKSTVNKESNPFRVDENVSEKQANIAAVLNSCDGKSSIAETGTMVTTRYLPVTYTNASYMCGPIASSIVLYYLYCYKGLNIPSYVFSYYGIPCQGIIEYMLNNGYIVGRSYLNEGMSSYDMVHGTFFGYKGLNTFLNDIGSYYRLGVKWLNGNNYNQQAISEIRQSIASDYPVIISTSSSPDPGLAIDHFYIAYGYIEYLTFTRFIVNDGYGNNGIEINALARNLYDAVLVS